MSTEEQARELGTKQRQHEQHVHESMLKRLESEIGVNRDATNTSQ